FVPSLHVKGKAMHRKAPQLFSLMREMVTSVHFTDTQRIKEVLIKHYTALESSLNQNALRYAINLSARGLNTAAMVANAWYGLDYFLLMRHLINNLDTQINPLVDKLRLLQEQLLCLKEGHLVLSCDASIYQQLKQQGFYGLETLPTRPFVPWHMK